MSGSYVDGSIDGHRGVHNGLTPVCLSRTSAMCPPSARTVTRTLSFSIVAARRPRYALSRTARHYASRLPQSTTEDAEGEITRARSWVIIGTWSVFQRQ